MMEIRRLFSWMVVVGILMITAGCASNGLASDDIYPEEPEFQFGEDADIQDTPEVREVVDVLFQYRQALIAKDFGTLNRLVSENYYENTGTTHTTADDYGHSGLAEVFEMMAEYAKEIRYSVTVQDVVVRDNQAHIDFEFQYAYQYQIADKETWDAGVDVNRMELHREGNAWRIVGGM